MHEKRADLEAIKTRLIDAGYPRPAAGQPASGVRETSAAAQRARAALREHIIEDLWALLEEVQQLRSRTGAD